VGCNNEEHLNHQSPTWATTMNRISSQALEWQKNHEDNGDGVTSNNEKLWPLSLSPVPPNPKLASESKKIQKTGPVPMF
jgi:hypothetical protein